MENLFLKSVFSGLSGLQLNIPKYRFPEEFQKSSRLTYYSSLFNSIEINKSFYQIPRPETMGKWAGEVPDHFRFTFKLFRDLTHTKETSFSEELLHQFFHAIDAVGSKKGCVLIQFPPSVGIEYAGKLGTLLYSISLINHSGWKMAVEFRNKTWYQQSGYDLLRNFNASLVMHDIPKSATPMMDQEGDVVYLRFHGPTGNYRDSYAEDFLSEYSTYVQEWVQSGKTVYLYFNNTMGDAYQNLTTINEMLSNKLTLIK